MNDSEDTSQADIPDDTFVDLELYITIVDHFGTKGKPALVLRKVLSNRYEIQHLLKKAYRKEPIITKIIIKDEVLAIPRLARLNLIDPADFDHLF